MVPASGKKRSKGNWIIMYKDISRLKVDEVLFNFLEEEVLPGLNIKSEYFWSNFSSYIKELAPINANLLEKRQNLQKQIDNYYKNTGTSEQNIDSYKKYLSSIGYIERDNGPFKIQTSNVDNELSTIAGPQLVVPISNARYALNAANSRWGSLYDALYGTDALSKTKHNQSAFDINRGQGVIEWGKSFLDDTIPLTEGSFKDISKIEIKEEKLQFVIKGKQVGLQTPNQFIGYQGPKEEPNVILLSHHGLHIEIHINPDHVVGKNDPAGISDIILESTLSTIMDLEDSVAAVDGDDKTECYRNWLGLMQGNLNDHFEKNGKEITRSLNADKQYKGSDGLEVKLHGRSLILVRNVGHLMTNPAILYGAGHEIPEGLMDAMITSLIAMYDLNKEQDNPIRNSRTGSIYIVKPKMHGSEEVAFACETFKKVEAILGLAENTIKIGIMDEERRTSVNLKECIRAAANRVFFINTGFLDRTGDEIHTTLSAGPVIRKAEIKNSKWIKAYEDRNVDIGLMCGFAGKAQIGKGMWAMPDLMSDMLKLKVEHPRAGANTAWVPSPTAATLHATHYHRVDVFSKQSELKSRKLGSLDDLLTPPIAEETNWSMDEIQAELDNNAQGILGYVVRWINQGIGCSKVPDIHDIGLMEDRATLRISSQHMASWLYHGIVTDQQILQSMKKMALIVDQQNASDPTYTSMAPSYDGIAFQAACDLVFKGAKQPSGYTEPILHEHRLVIKSM